MDPGAFALGNGRQREEESDPTRRTGWSKTAIERNGEIEREKERGGRTRAFPVGPVWTAG